ncbi:MULTISPECIES: LLM class flavin-dependent oxidoreductase [Pseudonocardia]|uniref:LLM class flavin-dependent oxidoreductase n=1 Tax=Pseudonocardia TaxID=1847 RepID=UPI001E2E3852|nr:LLM class flavin-dependent oxidoreductase [Pseudonocardia terrae]MCE3551131.1 LLM class flavin-dependent oxidoreductase [Pseudonocardia terrae]
MKVHMTNLIQNYNNADSDYDIYKDQIALSLRADQDGYESIGCVEHHFDPGYSMCPDNTQFLSYLAGRTTNAKMHTTAVILPWNDPLRVVEKIALLDNLSDGRALFGMGRGLARREFEGFGLDMGTSRERFDEAAEMIIRGLEAGYVENDGKFYKQSRVPIHPAPLRTFKGRTTCVAMSPDSAVAAGKLGVQMMAFIQGPMDTMHMPMITQYREAFQETHGEEAPPPLMIDLTYCHQDSDEARRVAAEHIANYYMCCVEHYEFGGRHFESTSGYASYAAAKAAIDEYGLDTVVDIYVNAQIWGTPDEQLAKHEERRAIVGDYEPIMVFQFGGLKGEKAAASYELFTSEVMPTLQKM